MVEGGGGTGLGGEVAGDAPVGDGRGPLGGGEEGGAGDDAVDDDGHAPLRTFQNEARKSGDLEPAELGERIIRCPGEGPLHDVDLAAEHGVVDARPSAG